MTNSESKQKHVERITRSFHYHLGEFLRGVLNSDVNKMSYSAMYMKLDYSMLEGIHRICEGQVTLAYIAKIVKSNINESTEKEIKEAEDRAQRDWFKIENTYKVTPYG